MKTLVIAASMLCLSSCATYTTTLTNEKGQSITCHASGKNGLITGIYLRQGFERFLDNAEAHGFKE